MPRRRENGTGAVRTLPSGRWQARIADGDGQLVSLGSSPTKSDAANASRLAASDQMRGERVDPRAGEITMRVYADDWLAHRSTIRPRTRELYESLLRNHIPPTLGKTTLASVSPRLIRSWHSDLVRKARPGPVTVAKTYRLLRTILTTAVEDGVISRKPVCHQGRRRRAQPRAAGRHDRTGLPHRRWRPATSSPACPARHVHSAPIRRARRSDETQCGWPARCRHPRGPARRSPTPPQPVRRARSARTCVHRRERWTTARKQLVKVVATHDRGARSRAPPLHDLRHTGNTLAAATGASTKELMTSNPTSVRR